MQKFRLKGKVYYSDGTDSGNQWLLPQTTNLKVGSVVTYPAGFTELDLGSFQPDKTPMSYDIWLVNNNGATVSQIRTFYLRDAQYSELDFWYVNSLKVIESVTLNSFYTHGLSIDKQEFIQSQPFILDSTIHELNSWNSELQETYSATTGYMDKAELWPYIDMLMSNHVWWIYNGQQIPISINKGDFDVVKPTIADGVYDFALNFSFTKAFRQTVYSHIDA